MSYRAYFGIFVVILVGTYLSVRYLGAPKEVIPIGVSLLLLAMGLQKVFSQMRSKKNDK